MANTPWQVPQPQAIGGLNSVMVYGENLQVAVGLNHQIALGSNVQICINPMALVEMLDSPATGVFQTMLGSGLGGNMQFTIGSSANVVWGRQFTINMGPQEFKVEASAEKPLSKLLCIMIGAAAVIHGIAYGCITDDNGRATEVVIFQITMDVLLAFFMKEQMSTKAVDAALCDALKELFTFPSLKGSTGWQIFKDMLQYAALLALVAVPPIAAAVEENHFQGDTQDSSGSGSH